MSKTLTSTPRKDGYYMPAEWEPHIGCWLLWPERSDNWRGGARPAQQAFASVAKAISVGEPVTVCVSPGQYELAREKLDSDIRLVEMTSNDSWIRDSGPTFVINDEGNVRGIDWKFNAWGGLLGGLYFPWDQDDLVGEKVVEIERVDRYAPDFILEGGSIDVDGEGTLITTEECLLNENRNPNLSKSEIEDVLKEHFNVEKVIWLENGVYNDETDGHTDNFCRFVAPGKVILTWTSDKSDPQYAISTAALERLEKTTDAKGRKLEIHKIHQPNPVLITADEAASVDRMPGTLLRQEGDRMAASYINFYIGNNVIVMPFFDDPYDVIAYEQLQSLFHKRQILVVPGREILLGGGNIHCITQQEPDGHRATLLRGVA